MSYASHDAQPYASYDPETDSLLIHLSASPAFNVWGTGPTVVHTDGFGRIVMIEVKGATKLPPPRPTDHDEWPIEGSAPPDE
jgi:hypothetical protein